MGYKPDESALISYLYGEISPEEKEKIEAYLEKHPREKEELASLQDVRETMQKLPDREVIEPVVMLGQKPRRLSGTFRVLAGIAAAVLLLIVAGFAFNLSIGFTDQTVTFRVGEPATTMNTPDAALVARQDSLEQQIALLGEKIEMQQSVSQPENPQPGYDKELLEEMFANYQQQNYSAFSELVRNSEADQRQFIQELFIAFGEHIEDQRQRDLELINAGFQSLKSETDQRYMEAETLLTSIMYDQNTQNN